jgi:hypothetical protein
MAMFRTRLFDAALAGVGEARRHASYLLEIDIFTDVASRQAVERLLAAAKAAEAALAYRPRPTPAGDA